MTILDELAALARARNFGHGERALITAAEMALCRVSKIPIDWCGGCKKGHHRRAVLEHSLREGVDEAREPEQFDSTFVERATQELREGVDEARAPEEP